MANDVGNANDRYLSGLCFARSGPVEKALIAKTLGRIFWLNRSGEEMSIPSLYFDRIIRWLPETSRRESVKFWRAKKNSFLLGGFRI